MAHVSIVAPAAREAAAGDGQVVLSIRNLSLSFGNVQALAGVSLEVRQKEILAIIGPNGAGKTSLLNCMSGFYKPQRGEIILAGKNIVGARPDKIAGLGLARTFQNIELYTGLTVLENIMAARHLLMKENFLASALYYGPARAEEVKHRRVCEAIIDFLELQPYRKAIAGTLSFGVRKRVELGRALALEPSILLLDEPMAGMNMEEKEDTARFIIDIYEGQGETYPDTNVLKNGIKAVVLIEHDMGVVMGLADRITVFDFGTKIAEGAPEEIRNNPHVIKAYLGEPV